MLHIHSCNWKQPYIFFTLCHRITEIVILKAFLLKSAICTLIIWYLPCLRHSLFRVLIFSMGQETIWLCTSGNSLKLICYVEQRKLKWGMGIPWNNIITYLCQMIHFIFCDIIWDLSKHKIYWNKLKCKIDWYLFQFELDFKKRL